MPISQIISDALVREARPAARTVATEAIDGVAIQPDVLKLASSAEVKALRPSGFNMYSSVRPSIREWLRSVGSLTL